MVYTSAGEILAEEHYISISEAIAKYYQSAAVTADIPFIPMKRYPGMPDPTFYRHIRLGKSKASFGIYERWTGSGEKATTDRGYQDFKISGREMILELPRQNLNLSDPMRIITAKERQQMEQFALDIDKAMIVGNYPDFDDRDAVLDDGGLLTQATGVTNLDGVDSALETKSDIWAGFRKMIDTIPLAKRQKSPPMIMYMTEHIASALGAPDRIYTDVTEQDFIKRIYMGMEALFGRKIGKIIVTNEILAVGDTLGTHDRLLLLIPNQDFVARVIYQPIGFIAEDLEALILKQIWGWKGALCVFDDECVLYSDQITGL